MQKQIEFSTRYFRWPFSRVGLCAVGGWRSGPNQDGASLKGHYHYTHSVSGLALNLTARRRNKLTSTSPSAASTLMPESNESAAPDRPASRTAQRLLFPSPRRRPRRHSSSGRTLEHLQRCDPRPAAGRGRRGVSDLPCRDFLGIWGRPPLSSSHLYLAPNSSCHQHHNETKSMPS